MCYHIDMNRFFKRTKILVTVGPATNTPEIIEEIIMAGVNGCRLNCSHGTAEEREEQIKWIRAAAEKKGRSVAIVQDLQGPKIRLGMLRDNRFDVHEGDTLILEADKDYEHDGSSKLPIQYNLAAKCKVGEPLSMFDGTIRAVVKEIMSPTAIKIEVLNDGFVMSKKGLNLPDMDLGGDILTEKDMADLEWGVGMDIDYVAISFVQKASDIENLKQILLSRGSQARVIAKIETKKAVASDEHLEEIVKVADGIMVARADMAAEVGAEAVPIIQRRLVALCRKHGKLCIVASQMMLSMMNSPEPTRAEVSDVATAVIQGADVVMLSDETTNGSYPVETVKKMKEVILYTQNHASVAPIGDDNEIGDGEAGIYKAISSTAVRLAEKIEADVIICQTASGATAFATAAERPNLPIISVTSNSRVANQLALIYANSAFVRPYSDSFGIALARELKASGYLKCKEGSKDLLAVVVSGNKNRYGTDTIRVRKV